MTERIKWILLSTVIIVADCALTDYSEESNWNKWDQSVNMNEDRSLINKDPFLSSFPLSSDALKAPKISQRQLSLNVNSIKNFLKSRSSPFNNFKHNHNEINLENYIKNVILFNSVHPQHFDEFKQQFPLDFALDNTNKRKNFLEKTKIFDDSEDPLNIAPDFEQQNKMTYEMSLMPSSVDDQYFNDYSVQDKYLQNRLIKHDSVLPYNHVIKNQHEGHEEMELIQQLDNTQPHDKLVIKDKVEQLPTKQAHYKTNLDKTDIKSNEMDKLREFKKQLHIKNRPEMRKVKSAINVTHAPSLAHNGASSLKIVANRSQFAYVKHGSTWFLRLQGRWGKLCVKTLTNRQTAVLCRSLDSPGFGVESYHKGMAAASRGYWDLKCNGHESHISHCLATTFVYSHSHCMADKTVVVKCGVLRHKTNSLHLGHWQLLKDKEGTTVKRTEVVSSFSNMYRRHRILIWCLVGVVPILMVLGFLCCFCTKPEKALKFSAMKKEQLLGDEKKDKIFTVNVLPPPYTETAKQEQ